MPDHGKLLFASPALGGGTSGKTCLTCHEHGRDLSPETMTRKQYLVMGNPVATLAGVINFCIEVALRGEAIPENGKEMNDLLAYLPDLHQGQQRQAPIKNPGQGQGFFYNTFKTK